MIIVPGEKKSFVLYTDMKTPLTLLTNEQRGELLMSLFDYAETGKLPEFDGALEMAFTFIRQQLDRDAAAWEETRQRRSEAGRKGAAATNGKGRQSPAMPNNAEQCPANPAVTVNENVNATVNENVNVNNTEDSNERDSGVCEQFTSKSGQVYTIHYDA